MKITKILSISFVIVLSLLLLQCTSDKKELHKELTRLAADLNQSTPMVLDAHMRFDSVGVSADNIFGYYYTIASIDNPKELIDDKRVEIVKEMDDALKTNRTLQFYIQNEVTFQYIYRDKLQNVIDVITIETSKYKTK